MPSDTVANAVLDRRIYLLRTRQHQRRRRGRGRPRRHHGLGRRRLGRVLMHVGRQRLHASRTVRADATSRPPREYDTVGRMARRRLLHRCGPRSSVVSCRPVSDSTVVAVTRSRAAFAVGDLDSGLFNTAIRSRANGGKRGDFFRASQKYVLPGFYRSLLFRTNYS